MKMGTGFGMNEDVKRDKGKGEAEEANVLDRAGCPIIEFVFLVYVGQMALFGKVGAELPGGPNLENVDDAGNVDLGRSTSYG